MDHDQDVDVIQYVVRVDGTRKPVGVYADPGQAAVIAQRYDELYPDRTHGIYPLITEVPK